MARNIVLQGKLGMHLKLNLSIMKIIREKVLITNISGSDKAARLKKIKYNEILWQKKGSIMIMFYHNTIKLTMPLRTLPKTT